MSDDLGKAGHARGGATTAICGLAGTGVGDFGVKNTPHVAFLTFTLWFISYTVLAASSVQLVA
ncbi:hypothetical protein EFA46_015640 (plasmid) [Halarchaeum sp. CBA1220]|uniref:EMC6-like membrane protein n=1 Tax=Halarchaeum sp. CBA1220 TaxID=1853682 RepID=UPI000F3A946A|nr:hypothetical protein [Halarchaeum sp. CBA1220]QLC35687.1 hypothetical protein EFA46_015640 [Halarchaeum sp. CBA1220]